MQRLAAVLVLALAVALPSAAMAKKKAGAAPAGALSATPVTCPAADPVVWVNTSSKIYWAPGSEYYGKTKHGGYACASAAVGMGARAAKASPVGHHGAMSAATPVPAGKHKHKGGAMAPAPTPPPAQ
jgi:hypothetical protein